VKFGVSEADDQAQGSALHAEENNSNSPQRISLSSLRTLKQKEEE
jgi:hypothetical protein